MVSGPLGPMEPVLSAEERGSVTPAHRQLISTLTRSQELEWSGVALLSCLRWLCTSTLTEAPEVQVDGAWTDGSDAFCVVYRVPYGPPRGSGLGVTGLMATRSERLILMATTQSLWNSGGRSPISRSENPLARGLRDYGGTSTVSGGGGPWATTFLFGLPCITRPLGATQRMLAIRG